MVLQKDSEQENIFIGTGSFPDLKFLKRPEKQDDLLEIDEMFL